MSNAMYVKKRIMSMEALKYLCTTKDWYTLGDNDEYRNMLSRAKKANITTSDLIWIAEDILKHSKTEYQVIDIAAELAHITDSVFYSKY